MTKYLLSISLFLLPVSSLHADSGWFLSAGGGMMTLDDSFETIDPVNVFFRGGLAINDHISVGAEANVSLLSDEVSSVDFDVDTTMIFVMGRVSLGGTSTLYAMIGSSSVELTGSLGSESGTLDDSSTAFGFGIEFDNGNRSAFLIDYISYYDDDQFDGVPSDVTVDSLNFGYIAYF